MPSDIFLRVRHDFSPITREPRVLIKQPCDPPSFMDVFDEWWGAALCRHGILLTDHATIGETLGWCEEALRR